MSLWHTFKPTILFLGKFFGLYLLLSVAYGFYIRAYDTAQPAEVDPITRYVAIHCGGFSSWLGYEVTIVDDDHLRQENQPERTYDSLWLNDQYALSVEEGCNGINIMIIFLSFVIAFGGRPVRMLWFIPAGIVFIHLANIGRLFLLSYLNVSWSAEAYHFFHKYGFTAVLYLAILILWYLWVMHLGKRRTLKKPPEDAPGQ
jgi:exosortase family protein XrtF